VKTDKVGIRAGGKKLLGRRGVHAGGTTFGRGRFTKSGGWGDLAAEEIVVKGGVSKGKPGSGAGKSLCFWKKKRQSGCKWVWKKIEEARGLVENLPRQTTKIEKEETAEEIRG